MAFELEPIRKGDAIEGTPEHQQAVALYRGLPLGSRVIDRDRNAILYCLSVGRNEDRPPGDYLLFYNGQIIDIKAHLKGQWVEGIGRVFTYHVHSLHFPKCIEAERDNITQLMWDALDAMCRSVYEPPTIAKVEFK